jgi:hypothetical protein
LKLSIEVKILIGFVAAGIIMWLIFSLGDTPERTLNDVILSGKNATIENIDPIYTNAMLNAKNYGLVNHNIHVSEIPELFFTTYIGTKVNSLKVIGSQTLNATKIQNIFSNYIFINPPSFQLLEKKGLIQSGNATQLNTSFLSYNTASIQTMLQDREKIPEFSAYDFDVEVHFLNGTTKDLHVIVMRVISSATGEPYKHFRWAVSYIY